MKKFLLCGAGLFLTLLSPTPSLGCLNDYEPNHALLAKGRSLLDEITQVPLKESWENRARRLQKEVEAGGDYKVQNDWASALMHTGSAEKAIPILQKIEQDHPGLYPTASNLGTAYELAGDPVRALEWIRKGIERNPVSHEGSEWIHVRILEARIAHAQEPQWCPKSSVLGLDFGDGPTPQLPTEWPIGNTGQRLTLAELQSGLKYQLHERLQFAGRPDPIVASLLADFGDIAALANNGIGVAMEIYNLAHRYLDSKTAASPLASYIEDRLHLAQRANRFGKRRPFIAWGEQPLTQAIVVVLAGFSGIYLLRRRRNRLRPVQDRTVRAR